MESIHKFREYLLEETFKLSIVKNKVEILNYVEIGHFDSNKIIVNYKEGTIIITGNNLVISKLMNDCILVEIKITVIELRWYFEW